MYYDNEPRLRVNTYPPDGKALHNETHYLLRAAYSGDPVELPIHSELDVMFGVLFLIVAWGLSRRSKIDVSAQIWTDYSRFWTAGGFLCMGTTRLVASFLLPPVSSNLVMVGVILGAICIIRPYIGRSHSR